MTGKLKPYLVFGFLLVWGIIALIAQDRDSDTALKPDTEIVAEQYLIVGSASRAGGEAQVAVNPVNPNNIAIASMATLHQMDGNFQHYEAEFKRTPRYVITEFAITRDRGLTWHTMEDPMRKFFGRYRCLDPFAAFTPDGVMILGCEAHAPETLTPEQQVDATINNFGKVYGGPAIIWSTDGGLTFSDPVEVLGTNIPKELYGPWVSFATRGTTHDAPKITVDASNGRIFISGNSSTADGRSQITFRASKDRGRNWGWIYAFDSPEWPGSGGTMSAANGVLAIVYTASKVPAELNATCPCVVFGTSRDDGKTFERHVVPVTGGDGQGAGPERGIVAADPSKPGRFAILQSTRSQVFAYYTEDAGKTWSSAKSLGQVPNTTIGNLTGGYNSKGILGVAWRVIYPAPGAQPAAGRGGAAAGQGGATPAAGRGGAAPAGGRGAAAGEEPANNLLRWHGAVDDPSTSEIWSAISRDGGRTFSAALKVSTAPSPGVSRRRFQQYRPGQRFCPHDMVR
jgi:hypothetical protein